MKERSMIVLNVYMIMVGKLDVVAPIFVWLSKHQISG